MNRNYQMLYHCINVVIPSFLMITDLYLFFSNMVSRAVMHTGVVNQQFPLKRVAGKTFPAFPVQAQPAILRIW